MCAIAGIFRIRPSQPEDPGRIIGSMRRRGPDGEGAYRSAPRDGDSPSITLYHTRLAVIDPAAGAQPMLYPVQNPRYAIVYNGELYNTDAVRGRLISLGHRFLTRTDTEVVLHSFIEWGERCLPLFNGIFAFAVWDNLRKSLFVARDRMGVKPFFYRWEGGNFLFASELKTLLTFPGVKARLDSYGIAQLMLLGPGRTPGCGVFQGMEELRAGEYGWITADGKMEKRRYWKLTPEPHTENFAETAAHVRALVEDAVARQLISDVPIGTFLSGGLDSSLISSVACTRLLEEGRHLDTFSVDYKDNDKFFRSGKFQPQSDTGFIPVMQRYLSEKDPLCRHHLITLDTPALAEALYGAVDARDLPGMADVDSSLLLFCKEIRKTVTVALSGECADELFGGYPWYRDPAVRAKAGFPWAQTTDWRSSFLRPEYLERLSPQAFMDRQAALTLDDVELGEEDREDLLEKRMKEMMRLNTDWFMQTLLDRKDRMSMFWGLEVRVPFCDHRIAQYLYNVPWEMKDHDGYEKGLLRSAMKGWLPDEVLWRKKSPYPKTHNPSYRATVTGMLEEILADRDAPLLTLLRPEKIRELIESNSPVPWYGQLMTTPQTEAYLIQLNYWLKKWKVEIL